MALDVLKIIDHLNYYHQAITIRGQLKFIEKGLLNNRIIKDQN